MSYISRSCSSLVRQPYYIPDRFILKISGLESILASEKGRWAGRTFYIDEYTLILLFSRCVRCAQKRDCWESVRFTSERSRVRIPLGPLKSACVITTQALFFCIFVKLTQYCGPRGIRTARRCRRQGNQQPSGLLVSARVPTHRNVYWGARCFSASFCTMRRFLYPKNFGRPCRVPNPEVGCEPGGVINVLFENSSVSRFFLDVLYGTAGKRIAFMPPFRKFLQKFPHHRRLIRP